MDMWTMRLRRTGCDRGQRAAARAALPTAAAFAHMPTAFDERVKHEGLNDNHSPGNIPS
jgi:hypothetical protein